MRAGPYKIEDRAFAVIVEGVGGGTGHDTLDAIDSLLDWLDRQTRSQIAVLHAVLAATQEEPGPFRFVELDEIAAAEAAALRFALRGLTEPHSHTGVRLCAC